jgi:hypothetical protein
LAAPRALLVIVVYPPLGYRIVAVNALGVVLEQYGNAVSACVDQSAHGRGLSSSLIFRNCASVP